MSTPITPLAASKTNSASNPTDTTTASAITNSLTQADFLKLLVAQMTAQDPLNPQSNTDFAAQMAQFSALQASQSTQMEISKLNSAQQLAQANDLIGRTVMLQSANGTVSQGTVSAIELSGGTPYLVVNGGWYDLSQVIGITGGSTSNPSAPGAPSTPTKSPVKAPTITQ